MKSSPFFPDFARAHAFKKCEIDCLLLGRWQALYYLADEGARVAQQDFFFGGVMYPGIGLPFCLVLQAFLGARISLLLAQAIDRPAPGQRDHPTERFALLRRKIFRLIPNLHENLLQEIVGLSFVMNHPQDKRLQNTVVSIVKLRERIGIACLDSQHQVQVTGGTGFELRRNSERSRSRFCQAHAFLWLTARRRNSFGWSHVWSRIAAIRKKIERRVALTCLNLGKRL